MTLYPLLFRFHAPIIGNGFIADVDMRGRALLTVDTEVEEGESPYWIDGVLPGALAAGGATLRDAHSEFQDSLRGILSDIADECATFSDFDARVQAFFTQANQEDSDLWGEAVESVRAGRCGAEFLHVPSLPAEDRRFVRLVLVQPSELRTDLNRTASAPAVAA